jgi:hypothetical protein
MQTYPEYRQSILRRASGLPAFGAVIAVGLRRLDEIHEQEGLLAACEAGEHLLAQVEAAVLDLIVERARLALELVDAVREPHKGRE